MTVTVPRRSLLKGMLGAAGALVAGQFVVSDPKVIAGNLIIPNPEPTIIRADTMPQKVTHVGEGIVKEMNIFLGSSNLTDYDYLMGNYGLPSMGVHLQITSGHSEMWRTLLHSKRVRVYVVAEED